MRIQSGSAKGTRLKGAPSTSVRPSSDMMRETLFNVLQADVPGCRFLDLFAGTGAVGIEALSRGAERCTLVEQDAACVRTIRENLALAKLGDCARVVREDVLRFLSNLGQQAEEPFDVIFVDPPYSYSRLEDVVEKLLDEGLGAHDETIVVVQHHQSSGISTRWRPDRVKEFGDSVLSFFWDIPRLSGSEEEP